jgi:hypothetical protein
MKKGGARTFMLNGKLVDQCEEVEIKSKGAMKFQEAFNLGRRFLLYLKKTNATFALESYDILEGNQVEDIDFSKFENKIEESICQKP